MNENLCCGPGISNRLDIQSRYNYPMLDHEEKKQAAVVKMNTFT